MSYNPNIPVVTDYMVISQKQISANFQAINQVFGKNHVPLNNSQQGQHGVVTLRQQIDDPTTGVNQVALYAKAVSSQAMLFFRPESNATPIQLTYPSISTGLQSTNPDVYLAQQYSFLAGPFVVYVGRVNVADNTLVTLTPATTLLYVGLTVLTVPFQDGGSVNAAATGVAANQFTVRFTPPPAAPFTRNIYYLAIGK